MTCFNCAVVFVIQYNVHLFGVWFHHFNLFSSVKVDAHVKRYFFRPFALVSVWYIAGSYLFHIFLCKVFEF